MKAFVLLLAGLSAVIFPPAPGSRKAFAFHHENVLGTSLEVRIHATSEADADRAEAAVLGEIDRLTNILSTYNPNSEASRFLRSNKQTLAMSAELFEILSLFDTWKSRTNGALDPAAEVISQAWNQAARNGRKPTDAELAAAVNQTSHNANHWLLDAKTQTATHLTDTPIRFNTFTKSYIVDHAADAAMRSGGVSSVVVNIGGDLAVKGNLAEPVAIIDPLQPAEGRTVDAILAAPGTTVATSGGYRRGSDIQGKHFSHIVDPRTGLTAESIVSATVVAPNAVDAGALATALTILTPDESRQLVAAYAPAAQYLLIAKDGARIASRGWYALQAKAAAPAASSAHKVTLNFELARIEGQRYRRPYVAAWIEDQDKFPVRTIALWYEKPRWLPDLRAWHRGDRLRALAEGSEITSSVSSATRSPGKYSVEWDGKDNQGKVLKPGKYTVCLEVAREHGTYQLIRQEIDFGGSAPSPKQIPLQANPEVAAASLEYR